MRPVIALIAAVAATSGCGGTVLHYTVARGSSGELPFRNPSCRPDSAESGTRVKLEDGRFYTAVAPGRARIECSDDDSYVFEVRDVSRIALRRDRADGEGWVSVSLTAFDQRGNELLLGDSTRMQWVIPATLEKRPDCHGHRPCNRSSSRIAVRPAAAGDHRVVARFAGVETSIDLGATAAR